MVSINNRLDDELKARACKELGRSESKSSDEDDQVLAAAVKKRLASPQRVKVRLDDL
ncbi:type II toxin-antitoxin system RelB/DinJ family antitoxin, partial [Pseudomonas sp. BCRC 81390]|uniref:type II toxin-antitoxin system RelB/DinJ family antitoxin n=1 Tax=Pseudomonas sp. BCRC 81390 TaxID=3054778 RepID=UPI002593FC37